MSMDQGTSDIEGTGFVKDTHSLKNIKDLIDALAASQIYVIQPDVYVTQNNPVSDQVYTILAPTANVEIVSLEVRVVWTVTQPTNLRVIVTVDGVVQTYTFASPVSGSSYQPNLTASLLSAALVMTAATTPQIGNKLAFEAMSGRTVQIQIAVTWATTQPTSLMWTLKHKKR
jgi:hypothetical protein